jgi:hypothetical protein
VAAVEVAAVAEQESSEQYGILVLNVLKHVWSVERVHASSVRVHEDKESPATVNGRRARADSESWHIIDAVRATGQWTCGVRASARAVLLIYKYLG